MDMSEVIAAMRVAGRTLHAAREVEKASRLYTAIAALEGVQKDFIRLEAATLLAAEQADDEGLWFVAESVTEAYLQKALRDLATAIEGPNETGEE